MIALIGDAEMDEGNIFERFQGERLRQWLDRCPNQLNSALTFQGGRLAPKAQLVIAYMGTVAPGAVEAAGLVAEDRRDIGLLVVTSADRLQAGWTAAQRPRERGRDHTCSHIERLLAAVPDNCTLLSSISGRAARL